MNCKVAVLMSTYNGEKYLKEQIDSILNQKSVDVTLYVRDDGSSDNTMKIISSYDSSNQVRIICDGENVGPGLSFMKLLFHVVKEQEEYDYYAFADQDDIWLEEKLYMAINKINSKDKPVLYCSNQTLYQGGKEKGMKFNSIPEISMIRSVSSNDFAGCTMVFNRVMALDIVSRKLPGKDFLKSRNHDAWIYMIRIHICFIDCMRIM